MSAMQEEVTTSAPDPTPVLPEVEVKVSTDPTPPTPDTTEDTGEVPSELTPEQEQELLAGEESSQDTLDHQPLTIEHCLKLLLSLPATSSNGNIRAVCVVPS